MSDRPQWCPWCASRGCAICTPNYAEIRARQYAEWRRKSREAAERYRRNIERWQDG